MSEDAKKYQAIAQLRKSIDNARLDFLSTPGVSLHDSDNAAVERIVSQSQNRITVVLEQLPPFEVQD